MYLLHLYYLQNLAENENVKLQDALTISSNLAQSSALVEAKKFQIATGNLVNMNSTSSHLKKLPYKKWYSSKYIYINNMLYSVAKTDNTNSTHLVP